MRTEHNEIVVEEIDVEARSGDCMDVDDGMLERIIQAQRVVALEDRRLDAAIDELLKLESEVRSATDIARTRRVVVAIIQLCFEAGAWSTLIDQLLLLSQRQAQLKQAIVAMVQQAVSYLDNTPDMDTRNKLMETLNNVSTGKGLRSMCWYVVLAPNDSVQSGPRKLSLESLNLSGLEQPCKCIEEHAQDWVPDQIEESTQEQTAAPTCGTSPVTPPHQTFKPRDTYSSIGKLAIRKKATLVRKPSLKAVRRRLFDKPSPADVEEFLSGLEQKDQKRFTERYNFDPLKDAPLPGRFEWTPLQRQLSRTTSIDSRTELRRPESSTMSA